MKLDVKQWHPKVWLADRYDAVPEEMAIVRRGEVRLKAWMATDHEEPAHHDFAAAGRRLKQPGPGSYAPILDFCARWGFLGVTPENARLPPEAVEREDFMDIAREALDVEAVLSA